MLAACKRDRVELVKEEDARRVLPGPHECLMEVALARADVRIENLLDADVRERQPALAGRRASDERFAAPRRPKQHPSAGTTLVLL